MSTITAPTSKRKIIDLKEDTFKTLSIMAVQKGTNLKKYIEDLLNDIADNYEDAKLYAQLSLVLNFGHSPLYRHFCKRLHIEMLKNHLFINYWHIANPILSGRILKKSLQPLNILVKNLPRYSHAERPCILTVLMML